MAKFTAHDPNDDEAPIKPAMDEVKAINSNNPTVVAPNPIVTPVVVPVIAIGQQQQPTAQQALATAQAQAQVGLAQAAIDDKVVDEQIKKEEEHWVKSYWRPAMGWLYMAICMMDFIGFPFISMFLPIFFKHDGINVGYVAWQSLTLSNGGLIHLAFGAILGVSAWTRGNEKLAKIGQ